MINFDLPWNPMDIEQRIGRIHRIGQERDVFVFNNDSRREAPCWICSKDQKSLISRFRSYDLNALTTGQLQAPCFKLAVGEFGLWGDW